MKRGRRSILNLKHPCYSSCRWNRGTGVNAFSVWLISNQDRVYEILFCFRTGNYYSWHRSQLGVDSRHNAATIILCSMLQVYLKVLSGKILCEDLPRAASSWSHLFFLSLAPCIHGWYNWLFNASKKTFRTILRNSGRYLIFSKLSHGYKREGVIWKDYCAVRKIPT